MNKITIVFTIAAIGLLAPLNAKDITKPEKKSATSISERLIQNSFAKYASHVGSAHAGPT